MGLFRRADTGPGGAKKPSSPEEELLINEQAATVARVGSPRSCGGGGAMRAG